MNTDLLVPALMVISLCGFAVAGVVITLRKNSAGDQFKIVYFRCACCDCLRKGPQTPFNQGWHPLCNECAIEHFPVEAEMYGRELEQKYRTTLERKP